MKFNWKFRRLTTAEKLDRYREGTKRNALRKKVPSIINDWCHSDKSDGFKYFEHQINSLSPQNQAEVIYKLEKEHGFIIMESQGSRYLVVSEAVAAGREAAGWKRITARKQDLPLPCNNEVIDKEKPISPITHFVANGKWWPRG